MLRFVAVCILVVVAKLETVEAQEKAMGAASFIRLGSSARAISMGRAFTALAGEDALAMFWNPAGTALGQGRRIAVTDRFFGDGDLGMDGAFSFVSAGGSVPLGWRSAVGLGVMYFGVEGIEQYNEQAVYQGDFSDSEWLVMLSLARQEKPITAGINAKFISQAFSGLTGGTSGASGIGLDIGLIAHFWRPLRIGVVLRNRTDLKNDRVPTSASVGLVYERQVRLGGFSPHLVVATDLEQVKHRPLRLHMGLGLERLVSFEKFAFSLRFGLNNRFLELRLSEYLTDDFRDELENEDLTRSNARWSIGIGLENEGFSLDYTVSRGMLHDPHYLSLSYHY